MKNNKKSNLQKQLFKKYLLGFIIFQILFFITSTLSINVLTHFSTKLFFSGNDLYKKISDNGIESITLNKSLSKEAYIEILDLDYKVKYAENSPHSIGYIYDDSKIKDLFNEKSENIKAFFLEKTQEILIVHEQPINRISVGFSILIIIFFIFLLGTYIIFFKFMAKIVSNNIENPIQCLMDGINSFKNKQYSHRISFSAENELDDLKDTFNDMAMTIEKEIELRRKAEDINRQLILDITHDFKTPLANIEGYCDLLKDTSDLPIYTKEKYLDIIISNSKRTNSLMNDLFELTRIDYSGYSLNKTKVDFCEMLRRLLVEYITLFEDNDKIYEFNIPDSSIYSYVDKDLIDRAICNIINNFIKYSGNNTKITLTLKKSPSHVILIVSDDGNGIEKSKCESIFLPFTREDDSRNSKTGGTGLGLAISKKIIEKHNGQIKLISDIGHGCKFVITIPK